MGQQGQGEGALAGGSRGKPPLAMKEAAALFIECSRSLSPALSIEKYLPQYKELVQAQARAASRGGSVALVDPWAPAFDWAAAEHDRWDLSAGLNFMQFMDFLGKAALVAYSSPRFTEAFPTPALKMEHFLSAHMGLMDPRRWLFRVEARLRLLKNVMQAISLPYPAAD